MVLKIAKGVVVQAVDVDVILEFAGHARSLFDKTPSDLRVELCQLQGARSLIILKSGRALLSSVQTETLTKRFEKLLKRGEK